MGYKTLFFDADNTLFDFDLSEIRAFEKLASHLGYTGDPTPFFTVYQTYNSALWKALEENKIQKSHIASERFRLLLDHFQLDHDPQLIGQTYLQLLGQEAHLIQGALELVKTLATQYQMVIVTNGIEEVQNARMSLSPIRPYFKEIIISEAIGCAKPDPVFFQYALDKCAVVDKSQVLVIGDSLASDIVGGWRSGLDTCWYNPKGHEKTVDIHPTYEVASFEALLELLVENNHSL
jgi:2-haloacid dehalogenase